MLCLSSCLALIGHTSHTLKVWALAPPIHGTFITKAACAQYLYEYTVQDDVLLIPVKFARMGVYIIQPQWQQTMSCIKRGNVSSEILFT